MEQINLKNIDKSQWKTFRFDEIAASISERIDPNNTDLTHYIGLEHLDSDNIHINRMGTADDVNGQKLRCYPGDVIFGRRRAYQRKAAVCEVDGFCSAHSLVLRAKPEVIDPQLLPFFLHSDLFMHRAVDISVGSLSPTINWGILKKQEFLLPPKEQQTQLAELLWAMDEVIEKELAVLDKVETLFSSTSKQIFKEDGGNKKQLKDISQLIMGQSPSGNTYNEIGEGTLFLQGNAEFGSVNPLFVKYTTSPKKMAPMDSILFSVRAPVGDLNIADQEYCIGRGLASIVIKNSKLRTYIYNFLKYEKKELERNSTGSTFKSVNKDVLSSLTVVVPTANELDIAITKIESITTLIDSSIEKINSSKALQKSLINEVF